MTKLIIRQYRIVNPPPRCLISGPLTESGHSTYGLVGIPAKKIEIKVS
jgi:hypothetical protein